MNAVVSPATTDPAAWADLAAAAVAVLRGNDAGEVTLPSPAQYPHQWSWDAAFIAIGLARFDPARARRELLSLFAGQWSDGRLPHIVYHPGTDPDSYFPGPGFWRGGKHPTAPRGAVTSGIVQPPVHARAVLAVWAADPGDAGRDFLRLTYPVLRAWHGYLLDRRNVGGRGAVAIVHPWESGLDNSPLWDGPLAAARVREGFRPGAFLRRDTVHVEASHRPDDEDYAAYVALAEAYRDSGYDDGALIRLPFVVEDPLFNYLLLDAELALAEIAEAADAADAAEAARAHRDQARRLHGALLDALWDRETGRVGARDVRTGIVHTTPTVAGLTPLFDPWLPADLREATVAMATGPSFAGGVRYPLPSTGVYDPAFDCRRYWRGPTWINTNWLVWCAARRSGLTGLAAQIRDSSLALVKDHSFREYYDPQTGRGLGAERFSWSAALTLDMLADVRADVAADPSACAAKRAPCAT